MRSAYATRRLIEARPINDYERLTRTSKWCARTALRRAIHAVGPSRAGTSAGGLWNGLTVRQVQPLNSLQL